MLSRRIILRTLFALPVLLCLAGWLWSSTHRTAVGYSYGDREIRLETRTGIVEVAWGLPFAGPEWISLNEPIHSPQFLPSEPQWDGWSFLGFSYTGLDFGPRVHFRIFAVPYWFPLVVCGGIFAWIWRKTRRKPDPQTAFPVEFAAVNGGGHAGPPNPP